MYYVYLVLAAVVVAVLASYRFKLPVLRRRRHTVSSAAPGTDSKHDDSIPPITAGKDWKDTEPLKFRAFKPIYHITMALQSSTPSELIVMDSNYLSRVLERRETMANHSATVMGAVPSGHAAVAEVYTYLLTTYLPARYPTMFTLSADQATFHNLVTDRSFPTDPPSDPLEAFKILGETVEDDMFLLEQTDEGHVSVAFLCCHPAGFDPSTKLGKLLREIHTPVPQYEKIGGSMERFFGKLETGKVVKRLNWSVTTQDKLYTPAGTHIHDEDEFKQDEEVEIDKARFRVELQSLMRLPETKAILFSFKTYLYPLKDIKDEGLGPQLADAIDGLKTGNAPGMFKYKGAVRWGKSVCEYLRA